jgi:hypothetical protein
MLKGLARLIVVVSIAGCGADYIRLPLPGESDFSSATVNGSGGNQRTAEEAAAGGGNAGGAARTIEEGDVFKLVGDQLYVLNTYRGLQILDVSNPDAPVKQGTSPILGYPVEMYVRDGFAYVVVSDYFTWWQVADGPAVPFHGSQVRIVDVRQPTAPVVVGSIDLEGAISDTRIVGDVLYVVANRWSWYSNAGSTDTTDALVVSSIDLSNRASPQLREQLEFPGTSNVIHVSQSTLYVASPDFSGTTARTNVTLVGIDDPAGDLVQRGALTVDGWVEKRFQLDEHAGTFRVVSHTGSWGADGAQHLSVYSLSGPAPALLSTLSLQNTGGLYATRFDGTRGYLVTMVTVDPLEVIDLSDPANPVLTHSLVIPGVLHQLAPRGDRLLALGTDERWSGVAVSLFDVADARAPRLLSRVPVGQGAQWSWSNATWDDKALRVLDTEGMVPVPFSSWTQDASGNGRHVNGFQIVSFDRASLTAQGVVEQDGQVSRILAHRDRLLSISDRVVQAVDATDRMRPTRTGRLELAREVLDLAIVGGNAVSLSTSGWWWESARTELRVAATGAPEEGVIGRLELPFHAARLVVDGTDVLVIGHPLNWDGSAVVAKVDLSQPQTPRLLGAPVPCGVPTQGEYLSVYVQSAVRASTGTLVVPAWTSRQIAPDRWESITVLLVVDAAQGRETRLALPGPLAGELVLAGGSVWASHFETIPDVTGQPMSRFYADRLDLTNAAAPALATKINVPGTLVGVDGTTLFTRDYQWLADGHVQHALAEVAVVGDRAVLQSYLPLTEGLGRIVADGRRLYATTQPWWWSGTASTGVTLKVYASTVSRPLAEVFSQPVRDWMQLRAVAGGHLFLGSGYWGGPWELGLVGNGYARGGAAADVAWGRGYGSANALVDYSLFAPERPVYRQYVRTNGWVQGLAVEGNSAYVSSGIYGIQTVALTP